MLRDARSFLGMIRFSHTVFALPFALASAALAWRAVGFRPLDLGGILLCMVFARSAAMAFNRLADRDLDAANPRTAGRHLPAGVLTVRAVWVFFFLCSAGFVGSAALFLIQGNPWPVMLAVPVLLFICAYSLTKRFTALAHFWLGASLLMAPVAAWIAIRGPVELAVPLLLGGAVLSWVAGFDILYACQDAEFDRKARLRSVPAALGVPGALLVAKLCHAAMLGFLAALGLVSADLGVVWWVGVALIAGLLAWEHALVRADDLSRVNAAFFNVNAVVSVGLFVLVLVQLALLP
ncbi:MAG: putative 4-hydroxybenzoate polyprenyltransferase [Gemmataceae bacterium]|nr:putative 4-hydroxybenzoate polyprenyltransferase [Gemmataceae bacterium]